MLTSHTPVGVSTDSSGSVTIPAVAAVPALQVKAFWDGQIYHEEHINVMPGTSTAMTIAIPVRVWPGGAAGVGCHYLAGLWLGRCHHHARDDGDGPAGTAQYRRGPGVRAEPGDRPGLHPAPHGGQPVLGSGGAAGPGHGKRTRGTSSPSTIPATPATSLPCRTRCHDVSASDEASGSGTGVPPGGPARLRSGVVLGTALVVLALGGCRAQPAPAVGRAAAAIGQETGTPVPLVSASVSALPMVDGLVEPGWESAAAALVPLGAAGGVGAAHWSLGPCTPPPT